MDWDEFAARLLNVLLFAEERTFIVILEEVAGGVEWRVQFAVHEDVLFGECHSSLLFDRFSDSRELVERRLGELGWGPSEDEVMGIPGWNIEVSLPAMTGEVDVLVKASVAVMRDLFNMPSPDRLVYEAWREAEYFSGGFFTTRQLEELDKGEIPLPLNLGIRMLPLEEWPGQNLRSC